MSLKFVSEDKKRVDDLSALRDLKPTENRVVFVESTSTGASTFFYWNSDGEASNADGVSKIESNLTEFADGGGSDGLWERGVLPVDSANTDQLDEGSTNEYFTNSRARTAVDPDIYESASRLYVDDRKGSDPPVNYDASNYDVLPGRNEARAFKTIDRAIEEIKQNIRPTPSNGPGYVTDVPDPIVVKVAAGTYTVDNPISVPKRTSVQGDGLRTTIVKPQDPKGDMFHVRSRNFFQLFRFKDVEHPGFVFTFPSVVVETIESGGTVDTANIVHSPYGYECDYDEVFSNRYPVVEDETDRPNAVRDGQLVSVDPSGNNEIQIYESVPDGSGGYEWQIFADTSAATQDQKITSDNIILPLKPEVKISDPRGEDQNASKTRAQASITISGGKVDSITITDSGDGYVYNPTVSIAAPVRKQPYVIGSPYLYNSSSITGPFTTTDQNGEREEIPESMPLPYDINSPGTDPISGETISREVAQDGAGGGTKIDGRVVFGYNKVSENNPAYNNLPNSPLKSFVAAQFTQVNQGGPGHLLQNDAFGQYVSCFTTFSNYSYRCQSGGFALLSNSVSDFGLEGLVAEGKLDTPYTSADVTTSDASFVSKIEVLEGGSNYDTADTITIDPPASGTQAEATLDVDSTTGEILSVTVTEQGSGYETEPSITINTSTGSGATFNLDMDKVININVENLDTVTSAQGVTRDKVPIQGTAVQINGQERDVAGWTERGDGTYDVTFVPGVFSVDAGDTIEFFQSSRINSSGHAFEFPGSGVTYNALPEYGGVTDSSQEVVEVGAGNVFITSSDQKGNFRVGSSFKVNQTTGTVTLETDQFNLSGLNAIGPFKFAGNEVGVQLAEVTNRDDLTSNSSQPGNTVATVRALEEWVPGEVFDVLAGNATGVGGQLIGRDNIEITTYTNSDFNFDFTGIETEDSGTAKNDARIINFGDNLDVTNEDDQFGDPEKIVVDGPTDTNDLPEGNTGSGDNLYFTSSRVYTAAKSQLIGGTDIGVSPDDNNEELTVNYTGDVGAVLQTASGVPQTSTGDNGNIFIDLFTEENGVELSDEEFRKTAQEVIQFPGKYLSKEIDYENNIIKVELNYQALESDLP